jgi:hypothetical protein
MANGSVFPSGLDVFNQILKGDTITSLETNKQSSAIEQLERKIGINESQDANSLDKKTALLGQNIIAEVTRAQAAESALDTAKANDNSVVHLAGNETIAGTKTFSASPVVPAPTSSTHAVPKAYVDAETTRASTAEGDIAGDLSAEVTRAQGAESALDTAKLEKSAVDTKLATDITYSQNATNVQTTVAYLNPATGAVSSVNKNIPLATSDAAGLMSKEDVAQIQQNTASINTLMGGININFVVDLATTTPSQTDLQDAYETASGNTGAAPDGTNLFDENNNKNYRWYSTASSWKNVDAQAPIATNSAPGIVQGSEDTGKIYAETDGTMSVVGWDSLNNEVAVKAADSSVVHLTGSETIAGTKTFSTSPAVPVKTSAATNTSTAIATEAQVYAKQDKIAAGTSGNVVTYTGTTGSVSSLAVDNTTGGTASSTSLITSGAVRAAIGAASGIAPLDASTKISPAYTDRVETDTASTTKTISFANGTTYNCGALTSLTFTYPSNYFAAEVNFNSGETATTLTVPTGTKWAGGGETPELEVNTSYRLSFQYDGTGVKATCIGFKVPE